MIRTPLLKHADEIDAIVSANGLNQPGTISYCNTGHWAATNWFVLSEVAQVDSVKLMQNQWLNGQHSINRWKMPTSVQFAILKTKKWFNSLVN